MFCQSPRRQLFTFSLSKILGYFRHDQEEVEEMPEYTPPPKKGNLIKTLILDLDETLIHSSDFPPHTLVESFKSGDPPFYVFKRPGLDIFLEKISKQFDTFIFTFAEKIYADPILDVICPFIDENHRLYRDSCSMINGKIYKNLGIFKRSERELILVDDNIDLKYYHPDNTIIVPRWMGTPHDRLLINQLPEILNNCSKSEDVRSVISKLPKEPISGDTYM